MNTEQKNREITRLNKTIERAKQTIADAEAYKKTLQELK